MTNKLIIYTCASVVFSAVGVVGAMDQGISETARGGVINH